MLRILSTPKRKMAAVTACILATAALMQAFDANPAASQNVTLSAIASAESPGMQPDAAIWKRAVPVLVPLTAQGAAYATGGGSVKTVEARALHFEGILYVRVEWTDSTLDDSTARVEDFADGVALEFPSRGSSVPSICMGQADAAVNIWHWRADSQAGLKDPEDVYTGTLVDRQDPDVAFYTARDAGNPFADADLGPVQTLVSRAFGTLSRADVQNVIGNGARVGNDRWAVVFSRPFESTGTDQATFTAGRRMDMAIAVWNGSEGDRNGRKSVSQFVSLSIASPAAKLDKDGGGALLLVAAILFVGISAVGIGFAAYGYKETRQAR